MASYRVEFNLNDGVRTGGGALVQTIESGGYAVAPECEREGCVFRRWDSPLGPITSNTTITAVWIEFTTLYYSADGATNTPSTVTNIEAGSTINVSTIIPKKLTNISYDANGVNFNHPDIPTNLQVKTESLDAEFLGWHTDGERASEGLVEYYPGDPIVMWGNVTLYAVYGKTRVNRLPTFGTGEWDMVATPGYELDGWTTTRNGSTFVHVGDLVNENSTIYARWKVLLTLDGNGGTISNGSSSQTSVVVSPPSGSNTVTIPNYSVFRGGAEFLGWSTSRTATTAQYNSGDSVTLTTSTTMYAVWHTLTFTVIWKSRGQVVRTDYNVPYGATLTPPVLPSTDTTALVGWSGSYTNITSDRTLIAVWKAIVVWYRSSEGKWVPYMPGNKKLTIYPYIWKFINGQWELKRPAYRKQQNAWKSMDGEN